MHGACVATVDRKVKDTGKSDVSHMSPEAHFVHELCAKVCRPYQVLIAAVNNLNAVSTEVRQVVV